jgi:hypothetical protein
MKEEFDDIEKRIEESVVEKDNGEYSLTSFPTEMSCTQAFDELYACYSIGGQFRNLYRYGEMNNCKEKREKMKFCLFVKLNGEEEKKRQIAEFYKRDLAKKQSQHGSSENVWSRRREPLPPKPFLEE